MKEGPGNKALDVYGTEKEVSEYFLSWYHMKEGRDFEANLNDNL